MVSSSEIYAYYFRATISTSLINTSVSFVFVSGSPGRCTVPRVKKAIFAILTIALLSQCGRMFDLEYSGVALFQDSKCVPVCQTDYAAWVKQISIPTYHIIYYAFRILFVFILPCSALIVLNCLLFRALKRADSKRCELLQTNRFGNYNQVSITTAASVALGKLQQTNNSSIQNSNYQDAQQLASKSTNSFEAQLHNATNCDQSNNDSQPVFRRNLHKSSSVTMSSTAANNRQNSGLTYLPPIHCLSTKLSKLSRGRLFPLRKYDHSKSNNNNNACIENLTEFKKPATDFTTSGSLELDIDDTNEDSSKSRSKSNNFTSDDKQLAMLECDNNTNNPQIILKNVTNDSSNFDSFNDNHESRRNNDKSDESYFEADEDFDLKYLSSGRSICFMDSVEHLVDHQNNAESSNLHYNNNRDEHNFNLNRSSHFDIQSDCKTLNSNINCNQHKCRVVNMQTSFRSIDSNRTTSMLIVVVTVFLLVELPIALTTIIHVAINVTDIFSNIDYTWLHYIKMLSNFLIILSYPVNFTIYCSMSKRFRETFSGLFIRTAHRRLSGIIRSSYCEKHQQVAALEQVAVDDHQAQSTSHQHLQHSCLPNQKRFTSSKTATTNTLETATALL